MRKHIRASRWTESIIHPPSLHISHNHNISKPMTATNHKRAALHPAMPARPAKQARPAPEYTYPIPVSPDDSFCAMMVAAQQMVKNVHYRMGWHQNEVYTTY